MGSIVRPGIDLQDVLHPADKGGVLRGGMHHICCRHGLSSFFEHLPHRLVGDRLHDLRRFNSSANRCSVHRARPAGGSLHAMAINCASPSPSSAVARSRLRLRRPKAASSPSSTALANALDVLRGDPHLTGYLAVQTARPLFSLVGQQKDLGMPTPIGSHRSISTNSVSSSRSVALRSMMYSLHDHPSQCDGDGLSSTSSSNPSS